MKWPGVNSPLGVVTGGTFSVCPRRPATAQQNLVRNPALPQSAIYIVLYKMYFYLYQTVVNVGLLTSLCAAIYIYFYIHFQKSAA